MNNDNNIVIGAQQKKIPKINVISDYISVIVMMMMMMMTVKYNNTSSLYKRATDARSTYVVCNYIFSPL